MRMRQSLIAASTALAAGLSVGAAQAAPLGGSAGSAVKAGPEGTVLQEAAYRRCWIEGGIRHCRWFAGPYDDGYGYDDDYYDDYGPGYGYGYGPSVGFFFGGGGHHGFRGHAFRGGSHFGGGHFGGGHHGGGHGGRR